MLQEERREFYRQAYTLLVRAGAIAIASRGCNDREVYSICTPLGKAVVSIPTWIAAGPLGVTFSFLEHRGAQAPFGFDQIQHHTGQWRFSAKLNPDALLAELHRRLEWACSHKLPVDRRPVRVQAEFLIGHAVGTEGSGEQCLLTSPGRGRAEVQSSTHSP